MDQRPDGPMSVVIIGGGFAGAALAVHLLDGAVAPLEITIVETRPEPGRGVAYSTRERVHLVNGPASYFSLYPEAPEHFTDWLGAGQVDDLWSPPAGDLASCFAPRWVYGSYVTAELARAVRDAAGRASFRHIRAEATDIRRASGLDVATTAGRVRADAVVLATGVFPVADPVEQVVAGHSRYVANPWDPAALDRIADAGDVLLVGASLSMVDVVASLEARGLRGRYRVISRRGHLIEPHRSPEPAPDFLAGEALPTTARGLLRRVAAERRALAASGGDWQTLPPALRPWILPLWQGASDAERLRFNRHLRSLWDVSAHPAAPEPFAAVDRARADGRLVAGAGRLLSLAARDEGLVASIRWRRDGAVERLRFDAVVNCRGHQQHDWRRIEAPLARNLIAAGLVRPHPTGFGIDATPDGAVLDRDGGVGSGIWAIGHPLRGVAWESSSIPEQVAQAVLLARRLVPSAAGALAAE